MLVLSANGFACNPSISSLHHRSTGNCEIGRANADAKEDTGTCSKSTLSHIDVSGPTSVKRRTGRKQFVPKPERGEIAGENEESEMFDTGSVRMPRSYLEVNNRSNGPIDIDTGRTQMYGSSRGDAIPRGSTDQPHTCIEISAAEIIIGKMPLTECFGSGDCSNMVTNVDSANTPLHGLSSNRNMSCRAASSVECDPGRLVLTSEPRLTLSHQSQSKIRVQTRTEGLSESALSLHLSDGNRPCQFRRSLPNIPIETAMEMDTTIMSFHESSCENTSCRSQLSESTSHDDALAEVDTGGVQLPESSRDDMPFRLQRSLSTSRNGTTTEVNDGSTPLQYLYSANSSRRRQPNVSTSASDTQTETSTGTMQLLESPHANIPSRLRCSLPSVRSETQTELDAEKLQMEELYHGNIPVRLQCSIQSLRTEPPIEVCTGSTRLVESSPAMDVCTSGTRLHESSPTEVYTESTRLQELLPPMEAYAGSTRLHNIQRPFERSLPNIHADASSEKGAECLRSQEFVHVNIPLRLRQSMPNIAAETPTHVDTESAQMQEPFCRNGAFCLRRSLPITHLDTLEVDTESAQLSDSSNERVSWRSRCSLPDERNESPNEDNTRSTQLKTAFRIKTKCRSPGICDETPAPVDARSVQLPISSRRNVQCRSVLNLRMETETGTDRRSASVHGTDLTGVSCISPNDRSRINTGGLASIGAGVVQLPGARYEALRRMSSNTRPTTSSQTQVEIENGMMQSQGLPSEDKWTGNQPKQNKEHVQMRKSGQWRSSKIPVATKSWDGTVCTQLQKPDMGLASPLLLSEVRVARSRECVGVETGNVQQRWSPNDDVSCCSSRSRQKTGDSEGSGSLQSLPCDIPRMRTDSPTANGRFTWQRWQQGFQWQSPCDILNTHDEACAMEYLQTTKLSSKSESEISRSSSSDGIESVRPI